MTPNSFMKITPGIARQSCFELLSQLELVIVPLSDPAYTMQDERRNALVLLNLCASILLALDLHLDALHESIDCNNRNLHPFTTPPPQNERPP